MLRNSVLGFGTAAAIIFFRRWAKQYLDHSNTKDFEGQLDAVEKFAEPLTGDGGKFFLAQSNLALIVDALRGMMEKEGSSIEAIFQQIHGGAGTVSQQCFKEYVDKLPAQLERDDLNFMEKQIDDMFQQADTDGNGRMSLDAFKQLFYESRTFSQFDVFRERLRRKEDAVFASCYKAFFFVERRVKDLKKVSQGPLKDARKELKRIKLAIGSRFVQVQSKLQFALKDFVGRWEAELTKQRDAKVVVDMEESPQEEGWELVDPAKVKLGDVVRAMVRTCSGDAASGWIPIRNSTGSVNATLCSDIFCCTTKIAMTDGLNVKTCKARRKLAPGEVLTVLEGPVVDEASSMKRIRAKASMDNLEGWVTVQGNAGTVFAEKSSKHYKILQEVPLHKLYKLSDQDLIRKLAEGELVEVSHLNMPNPTPCFLWVAA